MSDLILHDPHENDRLPIQVEPTINPVACYLSRLAPTSRRSVLSALRSVLVILGCENVSVDNVANFDWAYLRYQHMSAIRAALYQKYKPRSASHHFSVVKSVLKEAWRLGQINDSDYNRAMDSTPIKSTALLAGRALSADELLDLIEHCDKSPKGLRDAALISVLYGAMLRRSEAVSINYESIDFDARNVKIIGKGRKERMIYIPRDTMKSIAAWITVRGTAPGPLFNPIDAIGTVIGRRMSPSGVTFVCKAVADASGVKKFTPHDFRRTGISDALDAGIDIATISDLVGHSSVATTAAYDRRGERAKIAAVDKIHVPFKE